MKFREGAPDYRKYDCCYYIIKAQGTDYSKTGSSDDEASILIRFNKTTAIDAYIYGGTDRFNAKRPVTPRNAAIQEGRIYSVPKNVGFLVVTIPEYEAQTELEFEYWVDETWDRSASTRLKSSFRLSATLFILFISFIWSL